MEKVGADLNGKEPTIPRMIIRSGAMKYCDESGG